MNFTKYKVVLLVITLTVASMITTTTFSSDTHSIENNVEILKSSFATMFEINFEGIREIHMYSPQNLSFVTRVIYQKPDFMYVEYLEPPQLKGKIIIDDGKKRMDYLPERNETKILPSFKHPQLEAQRERALKIMLSNFNLSYLPQEKILGRDTYVFNLSPANVKNPSLKLWIDKETYVTLQQEKYNHRGELIFLLRYIEVDFNREFSQEKLYEKIPQAGQFEREPFLPSYYTENEIMGKVTFSVALPAYLPPGYVFQAGELINEKKGAKLTYTNGLDVVVLFQRPKVDIVMQHHRWVEAGKTRIRYRTGPYGSTLVWEQEGSTFVLIGEISVEELIKIAQSVQLN